ncbi:EF hand domain-containing protein [Bradyrhizobium macuxiense]|uniref:EF hand domain-containing protein n=1 Tax=Bradyrhizobium macuxiense TaxID=1755647 RepID=A0A560L9T6_9BRAD|nr:EF-hand domain-containing protein [Bradyrhizobium macuxiense]TWB91204.1 EF hand domain-containing protein [Bradyrhizobium macuxiense]
MLFAIGAASSAVDLLSSLMSSKSTTQTGSSTQGSQTTGLFDLATTTSTSSSSSAGAGSGASTPQISPQTMSALLDAQSQTTVSTSTASTGTTSTSTTPTSRSDALKDLFSLIDADGNGQITKTEFENALGAGGTNVAQADDVFSKLDKNGDGSVSLGEMSQALQGHKGGGHHHHHMESGATDGSGSSSGSGGSSSDPLMQALDGATSTSVTNSDGSTTTTTTYADGSKVSMTTPATASATSSTNSSSAGNNATSSYNFIEQLIQRQSQAISAKASSSLSVSA